jgi:adenylate kinase
VTTDLNLIILGPPGAGKGTQSDPLGREFNLVPVSTGQLLREHRALDSELGRRASTYMDSGGLVPDELVIAMVREFIAERPSRGLLFDGFPRTVRQAEALDHALADNARQLTGAVLLDVPDATLIERIAGRRQCPYGHVYHLYANPPRRRGVCDHDGERLVQRDDDAEATVRARLRFYREATEPLLAFYDAGGLLRRVDGTVGPAAVRQRLRTAIMSLDAVRA